MTESASNFIQLLREIWEASNPVVKIAEYERGVVVDGHGRIRDELMQPGFHIRWWWWDVYKEEINERTIDLPTVYMTLPNGSTRAVSANVVAITFDPVLMWRMIFDADISVNRRAAGALAKWAREGHTHPLVLQRMIRQSLLSWGVRVKRVDLTCDVTLRMHGHMIESGGQRDT